MTAKGERQLSKASDQDFELFEAALDEPENLRRAFVRANAASADQADAVDRLLTLAEKPSFLDRPVAETFSELVRPHGFERIGLEIIREIGRGGMGVVYLAHEPELDRFVALKVLAAYPERATTRERWSREAKLLARLDHPRIAPIFRTGTLGSCRYLVSAFVEGETLRSHLDALGLEGISSQTWRWKAAGLVEELARALQYAHDQQVVHRDLKPSNVLLDRSLDPVLVDFGVAKDLRDAGLTMEGEQPGSLAYMSPEQRGEIEHPVGPASDVYALGLLLFECLLGERFRSAERGRVLRGAGADDVRRRLKEARPSIPGGLIEVCARAMEIDPARRYSSAGAIANELRLASRGELRVSAFSVAPVRGYLRRHRVATIVLATATLVAAATWGIVSVKLPERGVLHVATAGDSPMTPVRVGVRPLDPVTMAPGDLVDLGAAPLRRSLKPGPYRVLLESGGVTRELMRWIRHGQQLEIEPGIAMRASTSDMVKVAAGVAGVNADNWSLEAGTLDVPVESFWIDRTEVTNAAYREFVTATGAPTPAFWPEPYDRTWDQLPVVGISLGEARAYAEWLGKRLPTHAEWLLAASGDERRPYPWGSEVVLGAVEEFGPGAAIDVWNVATTPIEHIREEYLRRARPAGSSAFDVTPAGASEMFGNVCEWTESGTDDRAIGGSGRRMAVAGGRPWSQVGVHLSSIRHTVLSSPESRVATIGFRCVLRADSEAQSP